MGRQPRPRTELGAFLAVRRAAVAPQEVGLPPVGQPRRVPGLRREEVAQLAGVSVDYYVRLEQGRTAGASDSVLTAIARALRLGPDETTYLLELGRRGPDARGGGGAGGADDASVRDASGGSGGPGGYGGSDGSHPDGPIDPQTRLLLDTIGDASAMVLGRRMDVLAWNAVATALFLDFATVPVEHRNLVRLLFLDPRVRGLYADWACVASTSVALLRMAAGPRVRDPRLAALVAELSAADSDFRRWWARHDVRAMSRGSKRFEHPVAGPLTVRWQGLKVMSAPEQTLIVHTAAPDPTSEAALRLLAGQVAVRPR
ncbi:helix-turn-helix domain-containing protein [Allostreptomyces psammosilenae]|uniref:HTH cro/C1-type domain-containing protein n=1 Tax=Allostreptomyces psammosilenae TaxID=1892865 RepID=A0A852ZSI5_9ACTN|nr:helix-turn-helix transcriptional regulator [Allostreptomyces psammosilenae]NYI05299.1 hypothetical protein [Allostreptomyces psammosilenae]